MSNLCIYLLLILEYCIIVYKIEEGDKLKNLKAILGIGLTSVMVLTGILSVSAANNTEYTSQTITMEQAAGKYKTQGRTGSVGTGLSMDWSGAGVEFNADCEGSIVVDLKVQSYTQHAYLTAVVDGVRSNRLEAKASSDAEDVKLEIASNLTKGRHTIGLYNQTECIAALVSIESIQLNGQLLDPPKNNNMMIEYVGDSYFTGYGCMVGSGNDQVDLNDTPLISDGTQSIGVLASQNLNADYSVVSVSGYGLTCGTSGRESNVPKYYDYVSWQRSHTDSSTDQWSFSRQPDIVVIELGDNDRYFASGCGVTKDDFKAEAKTFAQHIRSKSPNAKIVWVMYGYENEITSAFKELGGEAAGFYTTKLALGSSGVFGHPDQTELHTAADTFTAYLRDTIISPKPTVTTTTSTTATTSTMAADTTTSAVTSAATVTDSPATIATAESTGTAEMETTGTAVSSAPKTGDESRAVLPWLIGFDILAISTAIIVYKKNRICD